MADAIELVRAICGAAQVTPADAEDILLTALEREVDPLLYCAASLGLGQTIVMQRAAEWARLAFYEVVPRGLKGASEPTRLEALAEVRLFRIRVIDRDVLFCAPTFFELLALRQRLRSNPDLARRMCLVPSGELRDYLVRTSSRALLVRARQGLARRWPFATAQLELTRPARLGFVGGVALLFVLVLLAPFVGAYWLLPLTALVLGAPAGLRLAATLHGLRRTWPPIPIRPDDAELPVYSVLIPLRDEAQMVPQLYRAMCALDYPAEKLDIKFVVEDRSPETLQAARQWPGDPRFSVVAVPDAAPRTKPKALDFALPLCRGEHVVVFDAEDTPDPDQLWLAALQFRDEPALECLQAELFIDNAGENALAGLFAGEYAGLFGALLPAYAAWSLPMPLGGTSNHFRTETLRQIGGWDAFNVTEDADLGIRLARLRLCSAMLNSRTQEEAPVDLRTWFAQRTRWMKGWMQTFIVHNRDPGQILREMGWRSLLVFEMMVLSMIVSPLLHSALALTLVMRVVLGLPILPDFQPGWGNVHLCVLVVGYASSLGLTLAGLHRQGRHRLMLLQLALPLYWLLMAGATLKALHELLDKPFYWAKTHHRPVDARAMGAARQPAATLAALKKAAE